MPAPPAPEEPGTLEYMDYNKLATYQGNDQADVRIPQPISDGLSKAIGFIATALAILLAVTIAAWSILSAIS